MADIPSVFSDASDDGAIPVTALEKPGLADWLAGRAEPVRNWVTGAGFEAEPGAHLLIPGEDGAPAAALLGLASDGGLWEYAALAAELPAGTYRLQDTPIEPTLAATGWALGTYRFDRYKEDDKPRPRLVWPEGCDRDAALAAAEATFLVRDLINTPAGDLGPGELAQAASELATRHGAEIAVTVGDDLLQAGYPAIHAVGRAAARAPRLVDLRWGRADAPRLTVVGKGVCFDSGGLNLKPAQGMKLMKKDMGGAAHALGLAMMVMAAGLDVRLRVLIPAVENSVAGNALRPLDVIATRKGPTVEVGNTDAEGRLILADALAEAAQEKPDLLVDLATLTGAARVALGTELPALFCNTDALAERLLECGRSQLDPLWRLPLWAGYRDRIDGKLADLTNAPDEGLGGAITAALFLQEFVTDSIQWAHIDLMAWNPKDRPGRPEGGEAMSMRALFAAVRQLFASGKD